MTEIEWLTPDGWARWRDVRLRALAADPGAFGARLSDWSGDGDREARWRNRLEQVAANALAMRSGTAVGQVSGAGPAEDGSVELLSMWVAPEARGVGVGDALVDAIVSWAHTAGARRVVLSVKEHNEMALALYRRRGFAATGEAADPGERRLAIILDRGDEAGGR